MKPTIPKGTRDFSPVEMVRRNFIFKTIREVFERYGYQPIETPAMENLETLTGKYGDEGDKLIFKILDSGNILNDKEKEYVKFLESDSGKSKVVNIEEVNLKKVFEHLNSNFLRGEYTGKALRYDLTVPFARYVVQHQNEIVFPFKRYQIQPVWRADKPQKGRYREFYQCDADVIGSDSLLNEVELVQIITDVYSKLGISVEIKINNRKILQGIVEEIGAKDKFTEIVIAIDKIEKIGVNKVIEELRTNGLSEQSLEQLKKIFLLKESIYNSPDRFSIVEEFFTWEDKKNEIGMKGLNEVKFIFDTLIQTKQHITNIKLDISLARGLNYYTGAIFEVKANDVQIGSICGGGRYDDLTGIFGLPNVSGVGISFGIDRIFDVMNELNLFENIGLTASTTKVLLAHFGEAERNYCIGIATQLRSAGINTEIYPDITKKISKQFDYANKKQIPFVIVVGGDEMKSGELALKDMATGEQSKIKAEEIIQKLQS